MTPTPHSAPEAARHFRPLEHTDFQRLEHAPFLKGLLKPFKGKGALEDWAGQCEALRDGLIALAQRQVLRQASSYPFSLLPVRLAQQKTGRGTTFLRWRNADRTVMGTALWSDLITSPRTSTALRPDLLALEHQRLVLNLQISLLHTLARQARDCADRIAHADATYRHTTTPLPTPGDMS